MFSGIRQPCRRTMKASGGGAAVRHPLCNWRNEQLLKEATTGEKKATTGHPLLPLESSKLGRCRHPEEAISGSIAVPAQPLSVLRHAQRMTRGRRGLLILRRKTLSFSTCGRFIPAHWMSLNLRSSSALGIGGCIQDDGTKAPNLSSWTSPA